VPGTLREVSERPARRTRSLEVRLVALQDRRVRRNRARLRVRGGDVCPLRLSSVVSLLGGAGACEARGRRAGRPAVTARADGLRQLVLRPPGRRAVVAAGGRTARERRAGGPAAVCAR